jgi:membrane protein DedA with SNARE-associated domain
MNLHILFLTLGVIFWSIFMYWFGWMNGRSVGYYEGRRDALTQGDTGE